MSESVIRGTKKGFTVLYNSALGDPRLSLKTIGLFAVMQSFPENWEYSVSGLSARVRVGRDAVRKCLKELEEAGYLIQEQAHEGNGRFGTAVYTLREKAEEALEKASEAPEEASENESPLTEKPSTVKPSTVKPVTVKPVTVKPVTVKPVTVKPVTVKPVTVKPVTVKPVTENRPQVNKHLSKETKSKHPIAPHAAKPQDDLFEQFWRAYPRKQNRAAALRAWKKLDPDLELCRVMGAALRWQRKTDQWQQDDG